MPQLPQRPNKDLTGPYVAKYTSLMETALPERNNTTTYRQAREYVHDLLRRNVIEAASLLLVQEGPDALTVRRIAHALECSTKIIYTMFKGKDGLANALYLEGCTHLQQAIEHVPRATNPATYAHDVSWAYWEFASANPSYYMVMFCGAIPNFQPSTVSISMTETAFQTVVGLFQQYIDEGTLPHDNAYLMAKAVWAQLHGVVSLYLMGHFASPAEAKDVFARTVQTIIASLPANQKT
jgi:AcrR family transcriptional regulator